ncbi:MAG TPA: hypothetical protein VNA89_16705 [Gemmatimonadaceae bacterium]|nr:hypothetical protein [Gemmatimonadaceae bacterium]
MTTQPHALLGAIMLAGALATPTLAQDAPRPTPSPADTAIIELRSVVADVRTTSAPALVPTARRVTAVLRGGEELALDDGTRWRVEPADRARAAAWQAGADVWFTRRLVPVIRDPRERLGADAGYDLVLVDAASGRAVAARYAGR